MIKKTIKLESYLIILAETLKKNNVMREDLKEKILKIEAEKFFEIFGKEISEKLNKAYNMELERKRDQWYYKMILIFVKKIGEEQTEKFLECLLSIAAVQEEDEG